jgi:hypothetical protein
MNKIPVYRGAFVTLPQDELANYVENIINRCKNNPTYTVHTGLISELESAHAAFSTTLIAARNKAIETRAANRAAKAVVLKVMQRFANAVEFFAEDEVYVVSSGLNTRPAEKQQPAELPAPLNLSVAPTGNPGEVMLKFKLEHPAMTRTNAVEFSTDGGAAWSNGTYTNRNKIVLRELPSGVDVHFRIRSIGSRNRVSAWTAPVKQVVL